jgi:hypothetical protein
MQVPPLATKLSPAVAYGSHGSSAASTGSQLGQAGTAGWVAALAAVMDIDDAANQRAEEMLGALAPTSLCAMATTFGQTERFCHGLSADYTCISPLVDLKYD